MESQTVARTALITKRGYRKNISGDTLTLYLSNNPIAAQWLARRIGDPGKVVLELCCAVGVTLEQMAPRFKAAIGVDIDPEILEACRKNIEDAGLSGKVELVLGDIEDTSLLQGLKADTVIYDIPYWYPEKYPKYTEDTKTLKNSDLAEIVQRIREHISNDIVIFAPRELSYYYFKALLGDCEHIQVFISGKHDRNYVLFGSLVEHVGTSNIEL
jgi:predicted RNA methylase